MRRFGLVLGLGLCLCLLPSCGLISWLEGGTEGNGTPYGGGEDVLSLLQLARTRFARTAQRIIAWKDPTLVCKRTECPEGADPSLCELVVNAPANKIAFCSRFLSQTLPSMNEQLVGRNAIDFLVSHTPLTITTPKGTKQIVKAMTTDDPTSPIIFSVDARDLSAEARMALLFHELGHRSNYNGQKIKDFVTYDGILGRSALDFTASAFALLDFEDRSKPGSLVKGFSPRQIIAGSHEDSGSAFAIDHKGRLLFGGGINETDYFLTRLDTKGQNDTLFGEAGTVVYSMGGGAAFDMLHKNGKVVIIGVGQEPGKRNSYDMSFLRLNPNGAPDHSFGNEGRVFINLGNSEAGRAIDIGVDGSIVGVGYAYYNNQQTPFIVRLLSNGTLDPRFSGNGQQVLDVGLSPASAQDVLIQKDGKILIVGQGVRNDFQYGFVIRILPNGNMDPSFANAGLLLLNYGKNGKASRVHLYPDGKMLVGGTSNIDSKYRFVLTRLLPNGIFDTSFGSNGSQVIDIPSSPQSVLSDIIVTPNGKILAIGDTVLRGRRVFAAARVQDTGKIDTSFGIQGFITSLDHGVELATFQLSDRARVRAHEKNGRVILSGSNVNGNTKEFFVYQIETF